MTIKQYIDKYFDEHVSFDDYSEAYKAEDFWEYWDKLESKLKSGAQLCFDWYIESPAISEKREKFIKEAVNRYIENNLKKAYTNGVF